MPVQNGHTSALLLHVAISISILTPSLYVVTFRNSLNMHIVTLLGRFHAVVIDHVDFSEKKKWVESDGLQVWLGFWLLGTTLCYPLSVLEGLFNKKKDT